LATAILEVGAQRGVHPGGQVFPRLDLYRSD
jgi:hypothetical protein